MRIGAPTDDVSFALVAVVDTVENRGTLRLLDGSALTLDQVGGLTNLGQIFVQDGGTSALAGAFENVGFVWVQSGVLSLESDVLNRGTFWLGDGSSAGGVTGVNLLNDITFRSVGELYFNSAAADLNLQPTMTVGLDRTLTNAAAHRMHGGNGRITGEGMLRNHGLIDADTPLRTLTIDVAQLVNDGNLWARSGNLVIAVDDWLNTGTIRVTSGSRSAFVGTLLTNDATGRITSAGGAELRIDQSVTNAGSILGEAGGSIRFEGNGRLLLNLPEGSIDARSGTVRFGSTEGLIQNFGAIRADEGRVEFTNGMDLFGGTLGVANRSTVTITAGTTTMTQVRTVVDATSTLAVEDRGTGTASLTHNGILENRGGTLLARSDAGGTATLNLMGTVVDVAGTLRADGGQINIRDGTFEETGVPGLDLRNGGGISFSNVDSTAAQMDVHWTGVGGSLVFSNYRTEAGPTHLNLTGWTARGGTFTLSGGSALTGSGLAELPADTVLTVRDSGTSLTLAAPLRSAPGSVIDLFNGGTLGVSHLVVDGTFKFRGGTLDGDMTLGRAAVFSIASGVNRITGDFAWVGDRDVELAAGNVRLGIDGRMTMAAGSSFALHGRNTVLNGGGTITNHGLLEGGAPSNNQSTFLDLALTNEADGVVRAFQNGAPTNTTFQLQAPITNRGLMEADGANLYFTGSTVLNEGTIRTVDNPAGSKLIFLAGVRVTDAGGATELNGALSQLEVSAGAVVELGRLSFTNGAGGFVRDANSSITANNTVSLGSDSAFSIISSGRFSAPGVDLAGELTLQGSGVLDAPLVVQPTGRVIANSSSGVLNGDVTVLNDGAGDAGRISILANNAVIAGTGTITNHGLIEGGATSNNRSTFLDLALTNEADGVVRAFQNDAPTNTTFQLRGPITNRGLMEADGANLYFTGSTVLNEGTIRTMDNPAGSKLIFLGGARVTDAGGTTELNGALSQLEVSGGAVVELGTLSFGNGSGGFVTGVNSSITTTNTVLLDSESAFSIVSRGRFLSPGLDLAGELTLQSSGVLDGPLVVQPTGRVINKSSVGVLNGDVTVLNDGAGNNGRLAVLANNARFTGTGTITNRGLIEGGATSNNQSTFLDLPLTNQADGVVRAFSNDGATGTTFQLSGDIVNAGLLEADAATLQLNSLIVDNSAGSWSAVNGGRLLVSGSFVGGSAGSRTTVDGDASRLELVNGSLVGFDFLDLTNGGDVTVSGTNTSLAILSPFTIGPDSVLKVASNGRVQAGGMTIAGTLAAQGGDVISDVAVTATGVIDVTTRTTTIHGNVTTTSSGSLISVTNSSTRLVVDGGLHNAADATIRLRTNGIALSGDGLLTNRGLIEGSSFSNNNTVTLAKPLRNEGVLLASTFGGATNPTFRITSPTISNQGMMRADSARLTLFGVALDHAGTMRAENGGRLTFEQRTVVTNRGGGIEIDGDASLLTIVSSSTVGIASLSLTGGGDVSLSGASLDVAASFTIPDGSSFSIDSSATLAGAGIRVEGAMSAGRSVTISAPTIVGPTGTLSVGSSSAPQFQAPFVLETDGAGNDGRLELLGNSFRIGGTGLITNAGRIVGGSDRNNGFTFIDNNIFNSTAGEIHAVQNGGATNTSLQFSGSINNDGVLDAIGGNLVFNTGASLFNRGTVRATDHPAGSRLVFLNGAQVTNVGGTGSGSVDGPASRLEITRDADVAFATLSVTNGASVTVSDTGSTLSGDIVIAAGSTLSVAGSGRLTVNAGGLSNAGTMTLSGGAALNAFGPVANDAGATLDLDTSGVLRLFSSLTNDGDMNIGNRLLTVDTDVAFGVAAQFRAAAGARMALGGDFANASTQRTNFDSIDLILDLAASFNAGDPVELEVAGEDLGPTTTGSIDNFALDTLLLSGASEVVVLVDRFDNPGDGLATADALYVSTLSILDPSSTLVLNGLNVYYSVFNGTLGQVDLSLGGSFTQVSGLASVPEPATLSLVLVSAVGVLVRRTRRRRCGRA